jgi:hypothetical protein
MSIWPSADRLVLEIAFKIVGKRGNCRVSFGGFFFSALPRIVSRSPRNWRRSLSGVVPRFSASPLSSGAIAPESGGLSLSAIAFKS